MFKRNYIVWLLFACFAVAKAQVLRPGPCPAVKAVKNVDWDAMQGRWFLIQRFPEFHPVMYYQKCSSEEKYLNENGTVSVYSSFVNTRTGERTDNLFVGLINRADSTSMATGALTFSGILDSVPSYTYYMLDVEYTDYHLLYGCTDIGPDKKWGLEHIGLYSRSATPLSTKLRDQLGKNLQSNNINCDYLVSVDQDDCPNKHHYG